MHWQIGKLCHFGSCSPAVYVQWSLMQFSPPPKIGAAKAVAVAFVGPMQFLTVKIFLLLRSAQGKGHKANGCNLLGACYGAYTRCRHLPLWTLLISCKQIFKCSARATPSHHNNNNSNKNNWMPYFSGSLSFHLLVLYIFLVEKRIKNRLS